MPLAVPHSGQPPSRSRQGCACALVFSSSLEARLLQGGTENGNTGETQKGQGGPRVDGLAPLLRTLRSGNSGGAPPPPWVASSVVTQTVCFAHCQNDSSSRHPWAEFTTVAHCVWSLARAFGLCTLAKLGHGHLSLCGPERGMLTARQLGVFLLPSKEGSPSGCPLGIHLCPPPLFGHRPPIAK